MIIHEYPFCMLVMVETHIESTICPDITFCMLTVETHFQLSKMIIHHNFPAFLVIISL